MNWREQIEILVERLDSRCRATGFVRQSGEFVYWDGPFASVLFLAVLPDASKQVGLADLLLAEAAQKGRLEIDRILQTRSANGSTIDGYLVLGVAGIEPSVGALRDIEIDPRVCRKHVMLFEKLGGWRGLERISVLALPPPEGRASPNPVRAALSDDERKMVELISEKGAKAAAEEFLPAVGKDDHED